MFLNLSSQHFKIVNFFVNAGYNLLVVRDTGFIIKHIFSTSGSLS